MYGVMPVTGHTFPKAPGTGPVADPPCGEAMVVLYMLEPEPVSIVKMPKLRVKCRLPE
jgi:hypothetical protein